MAPILILLMAIYLDQNVFGRKYFEIIKFII